MNDFFSPEGKGDTLLSFRKSGLQTALQSATQSAIISGSVCMSRIHNNPDVIPLGKSTVLESETIKSVGAGCVLCYFNLNLDSEADRWGVLA